MPIEDEMLWGVPPSSHEPRATGNELVETLICPYTEEKCNAWDASTLSAAGECLLHCEDKCSK